MKKYHQRKLEMFEVNQKTVHSCGEENIICNPKICSNMGDNGVIIYIYNLIDGVKARKIIRETYANKSILDDTNMRVLFVMGLRNGNDTFPPSLIEEGRKYNDILVANFTDSYMNLTTKGISALKFISEYCQNVTWIMKADDDVVIDLRSIRKRLDKWSESKKSKTAPPIFGKVYRRAVPKICPRFPKWCIHKKRKIRFYPTYVVGVGYVFSQKLVLPMLNQVNRTEHYRNLTDDVYMTGYLTKDIYKRFVNWREVSSNSKMSGYKMKKNQILVSHLKKPERISEVWSEFSSM